MQWQQGHLNEEAHVQEDGSAQPTTPEDASPPLVSEHPDFLRTPDQESQYFYDTYSRNQPGPGWPCPKCDQGNYFNQTRCWNCDESKPGEPEREAPSDSAPVVEPPPPPCQPEVEIMKDEEGPAQPPLAAPEEDEDEDEKSADDEAALPPEEDAHAHPAEGEEAQPPRGAERELDWKSHVSAFNVLDWKYFDNLTRTGVCVKEAVATVNRDKAVAAAHVHHDCSAFDEADWQDFHESLKKNGVHAMMVQDAIKEVLKKRALRQNACVVLEEDDPGTASTTRAEAMVYIAHMTRGYQLEKEVEEAKKDFEEQVRLQEVRDFEARVKSLLLEDK